MNDVDKMLARAQVGLAFFFAIFVFALVFSLIFYRSEMNSVEVTILTSITSVLATILTLQMNFFFARTRPPALPDPTTTTTTTHTETLPTPLVVPPGTVAKTGPAEPVIITSTEPPT